MTTTTLTRPIEMPAKPQHRHFLRDTIGWNRKATVYYSAVAVICVLLEKVHP